jgi:hypothetical protein
MERHVLLMCVTASFVALTGVSNLRIMTPRSSLNRLSLGAESDWRVLDGCGVQRVTQAV